MKSFIIDLVVGVVMVALIANAVLVAVNLFSNDNADYARLAAQQEASKVEIGLRDELNSAKAKIASLEDKFDAMYSHVSQTKYTCESEGARLRADISQLNSRLMVLDDSVERFAAYSDTRLEAMDSAIEETDEGHRRLYNTVLEIKATLAAAESVPADARLTTLEAISLEGFIEVFGKELGAACWEHAEMRVRLVGETSR